MTELYWTPTHLATIQAALPAWLGHLLLRNAVPANLSPRDVADALARFGAKDWGEGHPDEGDCCDADLAAGMPVLATYRATDFVPGDPFYIKYTPANWLRRVYSGLDKEVSEGPAWVDVLTAEDY
jgi:hypothetical protein